MSDIFGAAVEASVTGVTGNTWLVGEDHCTPGVGGDVLRYMYSPTLDGRSRDYYPELSSSDDVHYGSGIGIGIAKAARIFYLALRDYLMSYSGYLAELDHDQRRDASGASASYSYVPASFGLPGKATWTWSTPFGFIGSGTASVVIKR